VNVNPAVEPAVTAAAVISAVAGEHTAAGFVTTTVGVGLTFIVLVPLTAAQAPGALVVKVNVTVPVKLAAGVYVTVAGVAVCAVLLSVPPPEVMDQAPVVALPPTLAPLNVMAVGVADWQTLFGPPGVTVATGLTVMVLVPLTAGQAVGALVVSVRVTVPLKLAAGV